MSERPEMPPGLLTIREFMEWVDRQPKGTYELVAGRVVVEAMAPGLIRHARTKMAATLALRSALRAAGSGCDAFIDGIGIQVGSDTIRIPDASVNCGPVPDNDSRLLPQPVIVVEVLSPSTHREDTVGKFRDYFRVPSIRHYLILDPEALVVLHHRRDENGAVQSAILGAGPLTLDPPGITVQVESLFED
ncbi:Uma2 family endonuclease [Roseomonas stagni]|uniref:Uma2 family endonuclease n=1 Tax=Falsiroseomonas algicola TaxID=2716930 RepID=A0A6M1LP51_9PROT|nr:Uma2 family endonuclease [Falsiroseomonas algicola]NGM21987.1 Uma2 family endonuclease [Falsiroseomonas algicola]